jgi:hypothetical protein
VLAMGLLQGLVIMAHLFGLNLQFLGQVFRLDFLLLYRATLYCLPQQFPNPPRWLWLVWAVWPRSS